MRFQLLLARTACAKQHDTCHHTLCQQSSTTRVSPHTALAVCGAQAGAALQLQPEYPLSTPEYPLNSLVMRRARPAYYEFCTMKYKAAGLP